MHFCSEQESRNMLKITVSHCFLALLTHYIFYYSIPFRPSWFDHYNGIWLKVQIMKVDIM
jgi:hypothetical protein